MSDEMWDPENLAVEALHAFNAPGVLGRLAKSRRRSPSLDPASLRAYELLLPA